MQELLRCMQGKSTCINGASTWAHVNLPTLASHQARFYLQEGRTRYWDLEPQAANLIYHRREGMYRPRLLNPRRADTVTEGQGARRRITLRVYLQTGEEERAWHDWLATILFARLLEKQGLKLYKLFRG